MADVPIAGTMFVLAAAALGLLYLHRRHQSRRRRRLNGDASYLEVSNTDFRPSERLPATSLSRAQLRSSQHVAADAPLQVQNLAQLTCVGFIADKEGG